MNIEKNNVQEKKQLALLTCLFRTTLFSREYECFSEMLNHTFQYQFVIQHSCARDNTWMAGLSQTLLFPLISCSRLVDRHPRLLSVVNPISFCVSLEGGNSRKSAGECTHPSLKRHSIFASWYTPLWKNTWARLCRGFCIWSRTLCIKEGVLLNDRPCLPRDEEMFELHYCNHMDERTNRQTDKA